MRRSFARQRSSWCGRAMKGRSSAILPRGSRHDQGEALPQHQQLAGHALSDSATRVGARGRRLAQEAPPNQVLLHELLAVLCARAVWSHAGADQLLPHEIVCGENMDRGPMFTHVPGHGNTPQWLPPSTSIHDGAWKLIRNYHYGDNGKHEYRLTISENTLVKMRLSPQFTWKESALIPHRSIPQRLACRLEGSRCLAYLSQLKGHPTPANPRRPPCWDGLPRALRQPSKGTRSNSVPQGVNRSSPTPKCE